MTSMKNSRSSYFSKHIIKISLSSLLLWWSLLWVWYTILFNGSWISQQPLVVSVLVWMSLLVLVSTWWVISVKKYLSLRTVFFGLTVYSVVCVVFSYFFLSQEFQWLLKVLIWLAINILIFVLITAKRNASTIYRSASSRRISLAWNNVFALWTALIGAVIVSLSIMTKPLTCEYIYSRYDSIVESPLLPIEWSQQSLQSLWEQSVFSLLKQYNQSDIQWEDTEELEEWNTKNRLTSLESAFLSAKQSIIDETLEQRSVVTQNVCELVLWQIEDIRKTATRNISIVILLLVILSPIITLRFHLVSYISRWIFKLLIVFGVFRPKKKVITVDEFE